MVPFHTPEVPSIPGSQELARVLPNEKKQVWAVASSVTGRMSRNSDPLSHFERLLHTVSRGTKGLVSEACQENGEGGSIFSA